MDVMLAAAAAPPPPAPAIWCGIRLCRNSRFYLSASTDTQHAGSVAACLL